MTPIYIIGYMASGKSTFGRALARRLGLCFIDLDLRIEQRYHRSVSELFAERGEEGFREVERKMLLEVSGMEDVVVACGGGTPCFFDNIDVMLRTGLTVLMDASPERIALRLGINRWKRPLMAHRRPDEILEAVQEGLAQRAGYYRRAHLSVPSDRLENRSQISDTVEAFLADVRRMLKG